MIYPRREKIHTGCGCGMCTGRLHSERETHDYSGEGDEEYNTRIRRCAREHAVHTYRRDARRVLHRRIRRKYRKQEMEIMLGKREEIDTVIVSLGYTD